VVPEPTFEKESDVKTEKEIEKVLAAFDSQKSQYPGMTYEQGIEEALQWVLGEITDEEFAPAQ